MGGGNGCRNVVSVLNLDFFDYPDFLILRGKTDSRKAISTNSFASDPPANSP